MTPPSDEDTPSPNGPPENEGPDESDTHGSLDALALRLGMRFFLASLFMLFAASIVGFIIIRTTSPPNAGVVDLKPPALLWVSTGLLLASGVAMHLAGRRSLTSTPGSASGPLMAAGALSFSFLAVQTPALLTLLGTHEEAKAGGVGIFGLIFALIVLHALHVIGGLVPLGRLLWRMSRRGLGPSDRPAIGSCVWYWHFLEGVWVVMFGVFLLYS